MKVNDIMERNVEQCYTGTTIHEVTKKMVKKNLDQMPVVSVSGDILGIINTRDIIRAYIHEYEKKNA